MSKRSRSEHVWEPITVVNVVATASVGRTLDLMHVGSLLDNAEYYPKKFAALKLCRTNPYAKALVFTSGKLVCVGSVSVELALESLNWFIERIQRTMPEKPFHTHDVLIQNIVGSTKVCDATRQINLSKVSQLVPKLVQFGKQTYTYCPLNVSTTPFYSIKT